VSEAGGLIVERRTDTEQRSDSGGAVGRELTEEELNDASGGTSSTIFDFSGPDVFGVLDPWRGYDGPKNEDGAPIA